MRFGPLVGVALLATGRGRGIERFGSTREAFLASIAPMVAIPLVGAVLLALNGRGGDGLGLFLLTIVAVLLPPVVSHFLAVRWGREAQWLRYATAYNWSIWALPLVALLILVGLQLVTGGRMEAARAGDLLSTLLGLYALWLQWMVARHGLALGRWRAVLLVFVVNVATTLVIMAPQLLREAVG